MVTLPVPVHRLSKAKPDTGNHLRFRPRHKSEITSHSRLKHLRLFRRKNNIVHPVPVSVINWMARRPSINTFVESDVSVGCPLETISVAHANNEIADCGRFAGPCLYEDGDGGTVDADACVDGGLVMPYGLIVAGAVGIGGCAVGVGRVLVGGRREGDV